MAGPAGGDLVAMAAVIALVGSVSSAIVPSVETSRVGRPSRDVVGDREGPPRAPQRAEVVQVVLAVVASHQHLEHRLLLGDAVFELLGEEPHELLGDRGERVHALGPVRGVGLGRQRGDLVPDSGQNAGPLGVDERLVEPAEPGAPGQVADDGEPQLGGPDQALEEVTGRTGQLLAGGGSAIQRWRSSVARSTSGAERCCARKIRNTASSSCGVRSESVTP